METGFLIEKSVAAGATSNYSLCHQNNNFCHINLKALESKT